VVTKVGLTVYSLS